MYDFLNLSPNEFEKLCGQLLEKNLSVELEFFTEGVDGGIDFRYSKSKANDLIIQVKRYKNFSDLKKTLQREYEKVKKLKPKRYVIVTSVGLTPGNKKQILEIFKGVKLKNADIIGKEQLEQYLEKYPQILKSNFKLWLSSIEVLSHLLKSKIYTYSNFTEESIKHDIKLFVESESVKKAYNILKKERFLIISGLPGVGKSTLSRIITYRLLEENFDELVYISASISEGFEAYDASKKQIFVFDDFLGQNFLQPTLPTNEDKRIVDFAEMIIKNKKDVLIYVTREYILQQAQNKLERLNKKSFELNKFTLDISEYSNLEKAEILYNHLYFSDISRYHINNILKNKAYQTVIRHSNYNPRLIGGVIEMATGNSIKAKDFADTFKNYLDKPSLLWRHVFENQISPIARFILLILATFSDNLFLDDLEVVISQYDEELKKKYGFSYNSIAYKKAIKELETTFITTDRSRDLKAVVRFSNPSIRDFIISYINEDNGLKMDLVLNAYSYEQLIKNIKFNSAKENIAESAWLIYGKQSKLILTEEEEMLVVKHLVTLLKDSPKLTIHNSVQIDHYGKQEKIWEYAGDGLISRLNEVVNAIPSTKEKSLCDFISKELELFNWSQLKTDEIPYLKNVFKQYPEALNKVDFETLLPHVRATLKSTEDLVQFIYFENYVPDFASQYKNKDEFEEMAKDIVNAECAGMYDADSSDLELLQNNLAEIALEVSFDMEDMVREVDEALDEENRRIQAEIAEDMDDYDRGDLPWEREGREIDTMFRSLND
jgi:hypothetical protein